MADAKLKLGNDIWATRQKSLLAYNDEGGNFKSLPFQVERISSGTYVGRNGLIQTAASNEPRVDFLNNTKGHLLLEQTRRNLFLNSEDFTNSSWLKTRTTITGNQATAPDGSNNADLLTGSGTGTSYVYDGVFLYNATYYISIFVKNINGNDFTIQNFTQSGTAVFDLLNKSVTSTSGTMSDAKIEQYPNDWFRVSAKITSTLGGANANLGYGVKNYNGEQFYIWGAQVEDNASGGGVSYISSYIPTSSASVTRVVDFCFIASGLQNILNSSEGTVYIDVDVPRVSSTGSYERIVLSDQNASTDRIIFDNYGGNWRALMLSSAGNVNKTIVSVTENQRIKVAIAYSSTELRVSYDGNAATTTSGSYTPSTTLESFKFSNKDGGNKWQGKIYEVKYFDEALTNSELKALTS
mgnify:CR=1 FL=1